MGEHRVSLLGLSLRRYEDPATSRDPKIRAIVTGLQTLDVAPAPRAHFRAELRAQLVAVAPRLIADGIATEGKMIDIVPRPQPEDEAAAPEGTRTARVVAGLRSIPIARPLGVVATLITVFALLLGGAVWMSRKALPGDTLYGLKRASERVQYALTSGDQDRANLLLDYAKTRVDEAQALVDRSTASAVGVSAGGLSSETENLIDSNLASADGDVKHAAQLLGSDAVKSNNAHALSSMTAWAPGQLARLKRLANAMPDGVLKARTSQSSQLVHAALHRAKTLQHKKVTCGALRTSGSDELGPVPAGTCGSPVAPPAKHHPKHHPNRHHAGHSGGQSTASIPVAPPSVGTGPTTGTHHHPGSGPSTGGGSSSSTHKPPISLPTLPTLLPSVSLGVTATRCRLSLNVIILTVSVDACQLLGGTPITSH